EAGPGLFLDREGGALVLGLERGLEVLARLFRCVGADEPDADVARGGFFGRGLTAVVGGGVARRAGGQGEGQGDGRRRGDDVACSLHWFGFLPNWGEGRPVPDGTSREVGRGVGWLAAGQAGRSVRRRPAGRRGRARQRRRGRRR